MRSRGNSISQAEWLADPQMQNSYAYAREENSAGKRQFLLDVLDSIIFDDDALRKMAKRLFKEAATLLCEKISNRELQELQSQLTE